MKILRLVSLLFCVSLMAISSYSQANGRPAIGPKIGYNFSRVNLDNSSVVNGFIVGVGADFWLNAYSAFTAEILYSREGYEVPTTIIDYTYLQMPLLYNTVWGRTQDLFQPKLYLGFSPGFLLKAKINDVDFKDQNKNSVLNLVGGLGSIINLSDRIWMHVDARAYLGLTNIELNTTNQTLTKNRTFQISMGLAYGL